MGKTLGLFLVALGLGPFLLSQTKLDLQRQSQNMDFRNFPFTRPFVSVTSLPGTCTIGDVYNKTNNSPGQNLYLCTSTNTLTQLSSAGPTGSTGPTGSQGVTGAQGSTGSNGTNGNTGSTGPTGTISVTGVAGNIPKYNSGGTGLIDSGIPFLTAPNVPFDKVPLFDTGIIGTDNCVFINGSNKLTTSGPSFTTCYFGVGGLPGKIVVFDPTAGGGTNLLTDSGLSIIGTGSGVLAFTGSHTTGHVPIFDSSGALVDGGVGSAGPTGPTGANGATGPAGSGAGDVLGPATNTDGLLPQWNGNNSKTLKNGIAVVFSVGTPGTDTNIPTEKAIRTAISSGPNGPTGVTGATGANGSTGVVGATGANGTTGPTGSNGSNGATGAAGSTGSTGSNGTNGTNGSNGTTGATGATGSGTAFGGQGDAFVVATAGQTVVTPGWTFTATLLYVARNGIKQHVGGINDYTISGNTVVFNSGLLVGDIIEVAQ